jgi:hexulose-6-phosphate isomerase
MQGRLTPPVDGKFQFFPADNWKQEIKDANELKLHAIEWIYDLGCDKYNPIATDSGIDELTQALAPTNVRVESICADYFMRETLLAGSDAEISRRREKFIWLLERGAKMGVNRIILPFVDSSRLANESQQEHLVAWLRSISEPFQNTQIEVHLETDLPPLSFAQLLFRINLPFVKINYDSGNSASNGFNVEDEFAAYGNHIGSVHIKDRIHGGGTVPLGSGAVNFTALRTCLRAIDYKSPYILQIARSIPGQEKEWVRGNKMLVEQWMVAP